MHVCLLCQVVEEGFGAVHEALVLQHRNACLAPERHASYLRLQSLKHFWDTQHILAALQGLTPAKLQVYCSLDSIWKDLYLSAQ